jgi:hypothetical protein
MVSKKDRDDYEKGRRDREKSVFQQVPRDITGSHPGTEAYYKGRRGEPLAAEKKEKKKD